MRIKRIEIIGFKSFCDRTVVNITTPITSVVGPNGCGKSNIVDAIRWCMGEQSARHLRGKAMDDVIFAGSESRGPASMAEVSLTFDDVGFSHETLNLAVGSEDEGAGAEVDGAEAERGDSDAGVGAERGDDNAADAADAERDPAAGAESAQAPGEAAAGREPAVEGQGTSDLEGLGGDRELRSAVSAGEDIDERMRVDDERMRAKDGRMRAEDEERASGDDAGDQAEAAEAPGAAEPAAAGGSVSVINIAAADIPGLRRTRDAADAVASAGDASAEADSAEADASADAAAVSADGTSAATTGDARVIEGESRSERESRGQGESRNECESRGQGDGAKTSAGADVVEGAGGGGAAEEGLGGERSATEDVQEFLEERPPAFDFARYSEVTVTRRLFRDGTSQYQINRIPCRLRDVTDFFLGTGVGTKAYSIIEQGRVGMIVSSRPQERRTIIEEAAGITKFKAKKRAAERKLEQTRHNLLRVSDIVSELAKRMGSLRRQAQKAERYRRYKSDMREIEMRKATHRYLELMGEDKVLRASLSDCRERLDTVQAELEAKDASSIAERAELAAEERRLSSLQEVIYEQENRIKLAENKIGFQDREAGEIDERVAAARVEIEALEARRGEGVAQLEIERQALASMSEQADSEAEAVAHRELMVDEARQMLKNAQSRLDEARNQLGQARADEARAESRKQALARRSEETSRRLERVLADSAVVNERVGKLDREHREADKTLSALRQTRLDLGSQTEALEARRAQLEVALEECDARVEALRGELHTRRSRLQSLVEIQAKYEGFANGTRAVMRAAEGGGELGEVGLAMRGLVADVVRAPAHLEAAVEAVLGDRLGGILVTGAEAGLRAVQYLKETSSGRSAFVSLADPAGAAAQPAGGPQAAVGAADIASALPMADASAALPEGVLGRMVELVQFDGEYRAVGERLLGGCVVVDDIERALALRAAGTTDVLVTVDGDIVDDRGVLFGGSREAQGAGVLAQKREIRELEQRTEVLDGELRAAQEVQFTTKQERQQVSRALDGLRQESHAGEIAITAHEKDVARCRAELERLRERLTQLNAEQLELDERMREVSEEDGELVSMAQAAAERIDRFEREQLGLIAGVTDGRARVEELTQLLTEARVRSAQMGEKRASIEAAVLRLEASERELGERVTRLATDIEQGTERAVSLRADSAELVSQLDTLRVELRDNAETMERDRAAYEQRLAALQIAEVSVRELRAQAEQLVRSSGQLEIKLGNVDANIAALVESTADRYQVDIAVELFDHHLSPQVTESEDKRLIELKRLIARMGSDINLTAIDEFAEVSERHEFLSTQRDDLERAVEQLEAAIQKINRTSRRMFRDTYAAVNAKFQEVFPRLFRGGRARLQLTAPKGVERQDMDILDAGVEIIAQPPGKKNSTVEQLSGGEKALTAVALIFSIFLIKPSPFCLLDEVDAPLDDANVDRYNEIVREMTDRSQFIVITHNKRTMEIADNLYGVTMQEPGVSKLVSVNLSKIDDRAVAA